MMRRFLLAALTIALLLAPTANAFAESTFNETGYPICDETITITVSGANGTNPYWQDSYFVQNVEKLFGIRFDCQAVSNEAWQSQFTLMLANDELPDLISGAPSLVEVNDIGSQGYLLNFADYLQYMPNLRGWMEQYPMLEKYMTADDGAMYTLIRVMPGLLDATPFSALNGDWMDRLDLAYPETLDDLYDIFVAFRDQDADGDGDATNEIPLGWIHGDWRNECIRDMFLNFFGFNTRTWGMFYSLQEKDGQVFLLEASEGYRDYLRFMRKCYEEELLDRESFIQSSDEFDGKVSELRYGMSGYGLELWSSDIWQENNFYDVSGLCAAPGESLRVVLAPQIQVLPQVLVNANTKYPEAICRLLDYFYSDEGYFMDRYGIEGETCTLVPYSEMGIDGLGDAAFHQYKMTEEEVAQYGTESMWVEQKLTAMHLHGLLYAVTDLERALMAAPKEALDKAARLQTSASGISASKVRDVLQSPRLELVESFPTLIYTASEAETRIALSTDISTYVGTMEAQFISGEADIDRDWDAYVSTLERMGLARLIELEQAAYDRLMK